MRNVFKKSSNSDLGTLLNLFSEEGVTFALVGVVNIESGHLSVRTQRFNDVTQDYSGAFRECDECSSITENKLFFSICESCAKSESNYFWIPSGDGDGVYPVFELLSRNKTSGEVETLGFTVVMFPTEAFAQPIVEHALEQAANSDSPLTAFSFAPGLLDPNSELEAFEITKFKGAKEAYHLFLSDASASSDSNFAIPSLVLENHDDLTVLAFSEEAVTYDQGPKPRIIIGYSSNWLKAKGFQSNMDRPFSRKVFEQWTLYGMAFCHVEPMHSAAIWFNFKINEALEKYNYAASWLLQGALYGDADSLTEIARYEEFTSDPSWIRDWLEQRLQYQSAADFEDGRLTFPFGESNQPRVESGSEFTISFKDKCSILGQFWYEFKDDEGEMSDFIKQNDVGLPLAWFIATEVVEPLEMGEVFVDATFKMLLESMRLNEQELMGVESLDSLLEIVSRRDQNE
jgi:hypothetical protein